MPNFASLTEIPEPIDYVVCAVPRKIAPIIVRDCIAAAVGGVTLFTSGFAETGEAEGVALQEEIGALAREGDLALIGPNCMGCTTRAWGCASTATSRTAGPATWASSRRAARTGCTSAWSARRAASSAAR